MTCVICHFVTELDDIVVSGGAHNCVCLRCYTRETGSEHPMPKWLRRDIIAALAEIGVG